MANQKAARATADGQNGTDGHFLRNFVSVGFDSDIGAAALALGRDREDIRRMIDDDEPVDEDLEMKARGIAQERNFDI